MEQIWSYDREMGKVVEDLDEDRAMKTALINALKSIERIQSRRSNDSRQERLRTMARVALRTDFVFPWKTGVAYKKQVEGKIDERVNVILDLDLDP